MQRNDLTRQSRLALSMMQGSAVRTIPLIWRSTLDRALGRTPNRVFRPRICLLDSRTQGASIEHQAHQCQIKEYLKRINYSTGKEFLLQGINFIQSIMFTTHCDLLSLHPKFNILGYRPTFYIEC